MEAPISLPPATMFPLRSLGELLAMSIAERQPLRAAWHDARGEHEIYLEAGEVLHARYSGLEGAAAVFQMLDDPPRQCSIESGRTAPHRSVFASWARLCHAARCELVDAPRAS